MTNILEKKMKARYFLKEDYWILVDVLEITEEFCKIFPTEWNGIERKELLVPKEKLEFLSLSSL
jgi:hypothetical protein